MFNNFRNSKSEVPLSKKQVNVFSLFYLILLFATAVVFFNSNSYSEVSRTLPVGGSIEGKSDFDIKVKTIANNTEVTSLSWADQIAGSGWQMADSYIELTVNCNYLWTIDIYTNNPSTATAGYQKNGLLSTITSTTNTVRVPLAWVVSDSTVTITTTGEPGELLTNTITASTTTLAVPWTYLMDKNDQDDPNTTVWHEDWETAYRDGYTTVIYGSARYTNLAYGIAAVSPFVVYLEGEFYYVLGNMRYESNLYFDLEYK